MRDEILDSQSIEREYKIASKGKRLANHILDMLFYYFLAIVIGVLFALLLGLTENEQMLNDEMQTSGLLDMLIGCVIILGYYTASEYFFNGKTFGKLITKTRAVTHDDRKMDFGTTIKRSLCRLIPFEQFSFLGDDSSGWHDKYSNTKVIEDINWRETESF